MAGIVIVGATEFELSTVLESIPCNRERFPLECSAYSGKARACRVRVIQSGPGIANAAAAAAAAVVKYRPEHVYNVGVCGVFSDDARLLTRVVAGAGTLFADAGVESPDGYQSLQSIDLPFARLKDGTKVYNRIALDVPRGVRMRQGMFLTVTAVSGCPHRAAELASRCRAGKRQLLCEDMESAAVALVCLKANVACTVIRGISNLCGNRDYASWRLNDAARAAQEALLAVLLKKT